MTKVKLLSAGLLAATMLTVTPVLAREYHSTSRHVAAPADASLRPIAQYIDGRVCTPAPAVGAFATQPWTNSPPCEPTSGY